MKNVRNEELAYTMQVNVEELEQVTAFVVEALKNKADTDGIKEVAERLNGESEKRINMRIGADGKERDIDEYKKCLLADYIRQHGDIKSVSRSDMKRYAGVKKLDSLYRYLGELIHEGKIDFDMHEWSNHAGKFMIPDGEQPTRKTNKVKKAEKEKRLKKLADLMERYPDKNQTEYAKMMGVSNQTVSRFVREIKGDKA